MFGQVNDAEAPVGQFLNEVVLVFDVSLVGVDEPATLLFDSFNHFKIYLINNSFKSYFSPNLFGTTLHLSSRGFGVLG
ncbi:MAG: hypothetical protein ACMG6E_07095, partial [Candidatus Roizmanbacteria bacterium]